MKKIIKNGIIVTAADTYTGDVAIENGVITEIGLHLDVPYAEIIDASGVMFFLEALILIPIWICLLAARLQLIILRRELLRLHMAERPQSLIFA